MGTNVVNTVYSFWLGGQAFGCATPLAALERADWTPVSLGGSILNGAFSGVVGGISPALRLANPLGLTVTEANTILGCGGIAGIAPDPGYALMKWGSQGEVSMEYDDAGLGYKIFASTGFNGAFSLPAVTVGDASTAAYSLAIGSASLVNGANIDWTTAATADTAVTAIVNALIVNLCGGPPNAESSCSSMGDCTITLDDGNGHSSFTIALVETAPMIWCGNTPTEPLTFVFPQGTSTPSQIFIANGPGM